VALPNPWFGSPDVIRINYLLKGDAESCEIALYTANQTLVERFSSPSGRMGWQAAEFNAKELPNGLYFMKVAARGYGMDGRSAIGKWIVLR
jgi:hypothetical protein